MCAARQQGREGVLVGDGAKGEGGPSRGWGGACFCKARVLLYKLFFRETLSKF